MRGLLLILVLAVVGCGVQTPPDIVERQPSSTQAEGVFVLSPDSPVCHSTDVQARHLVLLALGGGAFYYHRDAQTGEWSSNLGVRNVTTTRRLGPGERILTGRIVDAQGVTLTVQWANKTRADFVFPSERALGEFLGRIVGPRGVPKDELGRTAVIAYERPCNARGRGDAQ